MAPGCMGLMVRKAGTQERAAAGSVRRVLATPLRIMRGRRRWLSPPISTPLRRPTHTAMPKPNANRLLRASRRRRSAALPAAPSGLARTRETANHGIRGCCAARGPSRHGTIATLQGCRQRWSPTRRGAIPGRKTRRCDQLLHPHDGKQRNTTDRQRMPHGAQAEQGRMGGTRRNSHPVSSERLLLEHQRTGRISSSNTTWIDSRKTGPPNSGSSDRPTMGTCTANR